MKILVLLTLLASTGVLAMQNQDNEDPMMTSGAIKYRQEFDEKIEKKRQELMQNPNFVPWVDRKTQSDRRPLPTYEDYQAMVKKIEKDRN